MALTEFQRGVCRLLADARVRRGESYVADGLALNAILAAPRLSRDVDLFHDGDKALAASWSADRALLEAAGYSLNAVLERPGIVEAEVSRDRGRVLVQWARDSAYRFFPLVQHADFGLTLHAFDLATNKVLALVGRVEARDWIDALECDEKLQPLGYLAWAACGKDPGLSPGRILDEASRTARYSAGEIAALSFEGTPPDPASLSVRWRRCLDAARMVVDALPPGEVGACVLDHNGDLFRGGVAALAEATKAGRLRFHAGTIGGAFPQIVTR